jgi:phage shock protein PspC (stress-responsive transcriptional regulator)
MNKVVTIHLDGIAYSLEDGAYDALRAYLDAAKVTLAQNPDKDEIIKDLEQAIGTKLSTYLNAYKNVVTEPDVDAVLAEMGPVAAEGEGASASGDTDTMTNAPYPHKRLYRIREGEWLAGVCNGLAAYFGIDVSLVRILFVLLTILTHGLGVLVYIVMIFVVPVARTPKDYAYASGMPPVTAQELVNRARKGFEDFANSNEWKSWKDSVAAGLDASHEAHRAWRHQRRAWRRAQKQEWKQYKYNRPHSFLSELNEFIWSMFGLLVMLFCIWFLYHHIPLVQQFLDSLKLLWDHFIYGLAQVIDSHR